MNPEPMNRFAVALGSLRKGDREVTVYPLLFGAGRLCLGAPGAMEYDDVWDYATLDAAVVAAIAWNPDVTPDPGGWSRHPRTGRRRPGGDPARETVRTD